MSKTEIRTLKLENLIREAVTLALFEQDQTPAASPGAVPPPAPPGPPEQNQPPQPQQTPPSPDQQGNQPPMTIDTMIERLNVIRGGKSFTDPEVYGQIVTYFKKMTPDQNQVIDQYLQDISKIMVNVRTGGDDASQTEQSGQAPAQNGQQQGPISPTGTGATAAPPAPATPSPGM